LRTEIDQFISCSEKLENPCLQILKSFCEGMKFHIYQKGLKLSNCQDDIKNLSDFLLFDNTKPNLNDSTLKVNANRDFEEEKLNTPNFPHLKKYQW